MNTAIDPVRIIPRIFPRLEIAPLAEPKRLPPVPVVPDMTENRSLKIACISDTHQQHDALVIPRCDVLVHAGDATAVGELYALERFAEWMGRQPARRKLFVPGNHDFCFDLEKSGHARVVEHAKRILAEAGITYLADRSEMIDGVKFHGSPWVPNLPRWAFHDHGYDMFAGVPSDTEVLITHSPAWGILDRVPLRVHDDPAPEHCGSRYLLQRIASHLPRLRLHVCGHIHEDVGSTMMAGTLHVNASALDGHYKPWPRGVQVVDLGSLSVSEYRAPATVLS